MIDSAPTLSDVLRTTAATHARRAAIIDPQGQLTYSQFDQQVDAMASLLCRLGIKPGESVAFLLWNQRELLIAYHGITRISAVTVSLNYRLTAPELAYQLDASRSRTIIYDESFLPLVNDALAACEKPLLRIQVGDKAAPSGTYSFAQAITEPVSSETLAQRRPTADSISGIWFTSGTEGKPKGAAVRHRSAIAAASGCAISIGIDKDTRCLAVAPLFHRGATENVAPAVTLVGGTHYLQSRFNPAATLSALLEHRISLAFIVPTMARMLIQELKGARCPLPHLASWITASAPMPMAQERHIRETFGIPGVVSFYGITEMLFVTGWRTSPEQPYDGSVGFAPPTVQVRIHNDQRGELPRGEVGEIIARGPVSFSYYVNDPRATQSATLELDGVTWYRTGDIGQMDPAGRVTILDRRKDMILSGAENIYSAEVEAALIRHPVVAEAAVVGRPDEQWGEVVVAFIVSHGEERPTLESIRAACRELATYKHPKEVVFIPALPRNSFGKVQKAVLKQSLAERVRAAHP